MTPLRRCGIWWGEEPEPPTRMETRLRTPGITGMTHRDLDPRPLRLMRGEGVLTGPPGVAEALHKECTVAIVDDDPAFCRTLDDVLKARGFSVITAQDPAEVLQALAPDGHVVLLDMKLNGTTGLDVLKQIRQRPFGVAVILVTGYREEMAGAIEAALALGAFTCLYKPFEIEELLGVLGDIHNQELRGKLGQEVFSA